jgi:hypothetical protein
MSPKLNQGKDSFIAFAYVNLFIFVMGYIFIVKTLSNNNTTLQELTCFWNVSNLCNIKKKKNQFFSINDAFHLRH